MNLSNWIIEIDITHKCNMRCRHCNRLCNAEKMYGTYRDHKEIEIKHIDFLCNEILKHPKGKVHLLRIIGGEPLLSPILDYTVSRFEELVKYGFAQEINIVTNGTVEPSPKSLPYLMYSPMCIKDMIKAKGRVLTTEEVYNIKNVKHRNITISPIDYNCEYHICDRVNVCGIQFSVYGFSYTAACFPAMYVSQLNHKRFLHHLPNSIDEFFDKDFETDVCSICVSAITDYNKLILEKPEVQSEEYLGPKWDRLIKQNQVVFVEPNTSWINMM